MFDQHLTVFAPVDETKASEINIHGDCNFVIGKVYEFEITGPVNITE